MATYKGTNKRIRKSEQRKAVIGIGSLLMGLIGLMNRSKEIEPSVPGGNLEDIARLVEATNLAPGGDLPSEAPFQISNQGDDVLRHNMAGIPGAGEPTRTVDWTGYESMPTYNELDMHSMRSGTYPQFTPPSEGYPYKMGEGVHDNLNNSIMLNELLIQMNK